MSDIRVIYLALPRVAITAPELNVRFECPTCRRQVVIDAYQGVPVCGDDRVALVGLSVVREPGDAIDAAERQRRQDRDRMQSQMVEP